MRFMIVVKATKDSEAGKFPADKEKMFEAMTTYHEELAKAGMLLDAAGLQRSAKGWRVKYSAGKRKVIDGPFTEAKEPDRGVHADPGEVERRSDRMEQTFSESGGRRSGSGN